MDTARSAVAARLVPSLSDPTAAHYLVGGVSVAVVVGTVVLGAPVVGHRIAGSVCAMSASCADAVAPVASLASCRVLTHADAVTDDAVVFTDDAGLTGRLTLSRTIDKDAVVHWFVREDGLHAGDSVGGVPLAAGEGISRLTEFASEPVAREYVLASLHEPAKRSLARADVIGALAAYGNRIDGHVLDPRLPNRYLLDGGDDLDLARETRAAMDGGTPPDAIDGVARVGLFMVQGGRGSAVTYQLEPSVARGLGLLAPADAPVGDIGAPKVVLTLSTNANNRPASMALEVAGALSPALGPGADSSARPTASGLVSLLPPLTAAAGPARLAAKGSPSPSPSASPSAVDRAGPVIGRVALNVDLTRPELRRAAADWLQALGLPLLLGEGETREAVATTAPGVAPRPAPAAAAPRLSKGKAAKSKAAKDRAAKDRAAKDKAAKDKAAKDKAAKDKAAKDKAAKDKAAKAAGADGAQARAAVVRLLALADAGAPGTSVTISTYRRSGAGTRLVATVTPQGGLTVAGGLPADSYYFSAGGGFVRWQACTR